jgi:hypothetical protein
MVWQTGRHSLNGHYQASLLLDRHDVARLFVEAFTGVPTELMLEIVNEARARIPADPVARDDTEEPE